MLLLGVFGVLLLLLVTRIGDGCGYLSDNRFLERRNGDQRELDQRRLSDGHNPFRVGRELDGVSAHADGVIRAGLEQRHGVTACPGVGKGGFKLQPLIAVNQSVDHAAQLGEVMVLDQLGGLLVNIERATGKPDLLAV